MRPEMSAFTRAMENANDYLTIRVSDEVQPNGRHVDHWHPDADDVANAVRELHAALLALATLFADHEVVVDDIPIHGDDKHLTFSLEE